LNGTHVNGRAHGGRELRETPEQGALRPQAEVELKDGDRLRVGATHLTVAIEAPVQCAECGRAISFGERKAAEWIGGTSLCVECRRPGGSVRTSRSRSPKARLVAGYELGPVLGKGGTGVVHRARRPSDGREVAIKLVQPSRIAGPEARALVLREVEVTRRLRHPNIVELLDCGEDGSGFFWVMEYCPAGSVGARVLLQGPLAVGAAALLALQALEGLAFAHGEGFVHRDIKPDNLLIGPDGSARLADFGLAKCFEQAGLSGMTATGAAAGTLAFMPREQITGFRRLRPVSDVWSLGATLYFMLTGQTPRDFGGGKDPLAVVIEGRIIPLRQRDPRLPAAVAAVVDRAIADDPLDRHSSAPELRDALREALS
jgi:serine/threonine protein kinase